MAATMNEASMVAVDQNTLMSDASDDSRRVAPDGLQAEMDLTSCDANIIAGGPESSTEKQTEDGRPTPTSAKKVSGLQLNGDNKWGLIDSINFDKLECKRTWLVENVLVEGQVAFLGGPRKSLKTSIVTDLVISIGTAKPFLGRFAVPKARRVAMISGESGQATIKDCARRVCFAKGIELGAANVVWGSRLPRLADATALSEFFDNVKSAGCEMCVIDPLYLCLLAGQTGIQACNLLQMGPLFASIESACTDRKMTLLLVHHTVKGTRPKKSANAPLPLEALAYSGAAEYARQWIMVNPRCAYVPSTGTFALWMGIGGSAGHSATWMVDITEGKMNQDFSGRTWEVKVKDADEASATEEDSSTTSKESSERKALLDVLQRFAAGETRSVITKESGIGKKRTNVIIGELMNEGVIEETVVTKAGGHATGHEYKAYKLRITDDTPVLIPCSVPTDIPSGDPAGGDRGDEAPIACELAVPDTETPIVSSQRGGVDALATD